MNWEIAYKKALAEIAIEAYEEEKTAVGTYIKMGLKEAHAIMIRTIAEMKKDEEEHD